MNLWKEFLQFVLPNYEYFTEDEKRVNRIAKAAVQRINMHVEVNGGEKKDKAFELIKERLIYLGIDIGTSFVNYAIERAVREFKS